jgi:prepilin-type N-terminal cleavage/methylation domain-containing protein
MTPRGRLDPWGGGFPGCRRGVSPRVWTGRSRMGRSGMGRSGYTLIELLTVMVLISVLAAIAQPRLRQAIVRARAATVIGDLNAVKVAVINYEADRGRWPDEAGPGVIPPGLEPYLPSGFSFVKPEYELDYDNRVGSGVFDVGLSLATRDEQLGRAVFTLLRGGAYTVGDRHTWVLIH